MIKIQKTILNKKGERLIFDDIIEKDTCYFTKEHDKVGILNLDGVEIIKPIYDEIILTNCGFYVVKADNLYGLIGPNGKEFLPVIYNNISNYCVERMLEISIDKKKGFYDTHNNYVIEPAYDYVEPFDRGMAKVEKDGKYGFIDIQGNETIPTKYKWISMFYADVAKISINGKLGYITRKGKEILKPEYDEVSSDECTFYYGRKEKKYTCVDKTGKMIVIINPMTGIIRAGEGFKKIPSSWCEEHIKFDSGISVIKQNRRFRFHVE